MEIRKILYNNDDTLFSDEVNNYLNISDVDKEDPCNTRKAKRW